MGIVVNQCDKSDTVIIWTFEQEYTLDEYRQALAESRRIARKIPHPFDLIVDIALCDNLAPDTFFELADTATAVSTNLRSVGIVGANIMVRTILSAFRQSNSRLGDKIYFAETLDQARQLVCPNLNRATGFFDTQEFKPVKLST